MRKRNPRPIGLKRRVELNWLALFASELTQIMWFPNTLIGQKPALLLVADESSELGPLLAAYRARFGPWSDVFKPQGKHCPAGGDSLPQIPFFLMSPKSNRLAPGNLLS